MVHAMFASTPLPQFACCLFLDVDGTLIEFADDPAAVVADEALRALLRDLYVALDGAVALVSGRPIEFLDRLFAPLQLPAAGLHGAERRTAQGVRHTAPTTPLALARARGALAQLACAHAGVGLEDKGAALALHYRRAPRLAAQLRDALAGIASDLGPDYHLLEGDGVLEIKLRRFDKGGAVEAFMQESPFSGRLPVFVGDDLTDSDGMRRVEALGGWSVAVGDRVSGRVRLSDARAARAWLRGLAHDLQLRATSP